MKKIISTTFLFFAFFAFLFGQKKSPALYKNPQEPIQARVIDLLNRMTLEEKVAQTQCIWSEKKSLFMNKRGEFDEALAIKNFKNGLGQVGRPNESFGHEYISSSLGPKETAQLSNAIQKFFIEKTRLGIPVLFHEESLHGNQAKGATNFPSPLGLASSWNEALMTEIFTKVAEEVRVRGAQQVLAPVVDLGLDPRWGRTEETLGEDPFLVSRLAVAQVKAYQGNGPGIDSKHVMATLKHFGAHGNPEGGINVAPVFVDERTLRQQYFPSFKACVQEAKVQAVMPCYNELSGIPAHANKWLLGNILRKEWGFKGLIVSDYYAINDLMTLHHIVKDTAEAAKIAIEAGVDIETPFNFAFSSLYELVKKGKISQALLDTTVSRILYAKFNCGLFDQPYTNPIEAEKIIGSEANRKIALKAAQEAIVLLKNNQNLLPLNKGAYKKIAVIGPNADRCILGGYSNEPRQKITPLQALKHRVGDTLEILYSEGVKITDKGDWFSDSVSLSKPEENFKRIKDAVSIAQKADVVLLFVGGNEATSREGWSNLHLGDNSNLELPGEQNELVKAIKATGKPIAAFVNSGPPLSFKYLNDQVETIAQCWYLGQETGTAIAQIIFGDINPSGKLPITIPQSEGHIPSYYYHKPSARRGYLFTDVKPLYAFGHGLSYTNFKIDKVKLSEDTIKIGETLKVKMQVSNTGKVGGAEVIQIYIRDKVSSITRPVKELKAFKKLYLEDSEVSNIELTLAAESFSFYDINMKWITEPGSFEIMVGNSSDNTISFPLEIVK